MCGSFSNRSPWLSALGSVRKASKLALPLGALRAGISRLRSGYRLTVNFKARLSEPQAAAQRLAS